MSDLNDQSKVCLDHPHPSFLVAILNAGGKLDLLLRGQQRCLHDLSEVNLNARLRIVTHPSTSPQIGSEATSGFDSSSDALEHCAVLAVDNKTTYGGERRDVSSRSLQDPFF